MTVLTPLRRQRHRHITATAATCPIPSTDAPFWLELRKIIRTGH
jgi:hypothetical protein